MQQKVKDIHLEKYCPLKLQEIILIIKSDKVHNKNTKYNKARTTVSSSLADLQSEADL